MRFYPAIHSDAVGFEAVGCVEPGAESIWKKTLESVMLMHSNNESPAITSIDFLAIENQARAARSAWIAREIKSLARTLRHRVELALTALSNGVKVSMAKPVKY